MAHEIISEHNISAQEALKQDVLIGISMARTSNHGGVNGSFERTFQQVERAKQEWESAIDSLSELICVVDSRGHIIRANRTVELWNLGRVISVQDQSLHELLHPACTSQECILGSFLLTALQKALINQPSQINTEDPILGRHLLVKVRPVIAKKTPSVRTATIVIQDITERKALEKALESYTSRLEVVNRVGKAILAANFPQDIAEAAVSHMRNLIPFQRARVTLRHTEDDDLLVIDIFSNGEVHRCLDKWLPEKAFRSSRNRGLDKFFFLENLATVTDLSSVEIQLLSEGIHSYLNIPLVAENEFIGSFGIGAKSANAFQPEHIEAAVEVAHLLAIATYQAGLFRKLEESNSMLHQAVQARHEMVQNVSHELNNPLAIAKGYAFLMKDEAFGPMTDDQENALDILDDQLNKLDFMLNRLLTLQSLDKKDLQVEIISLEPLIQSLVDGWQIRATSAGIKLQTKMAPALPKISADPDLLSQAVATLLDNGIKFSPDGGPIITRSWTEGNDLMIAVSDQGVGIPKEELETIFERFYQADGSTTRSSGGMGIGLALCREIIAAHDGCVWAESEGEGCGSTFFIRLPLDGESGLQEV
ncbi:MAG: ATP-binding protein [Candidatus Promineifilaceae bacterium]